MKGQATVAIIILILIVGLFVVFQQKTSPIVTEKTSCISIDRSKQIRYKDNNYVLIRNVSALSTEQFIWHMTELTDLTYNSQKVYRASTNSEAGTRRFPDGSLPATFNKYVEDAKTNPDGPASETYRTKDNSFKVDDMLFAEVGDIYNISQSGYVFVEIFFKESKIQNLPAFITEFCNESQPTDPMVIFPSAKDGEMYPPSVVNRSEIQFDTGKSVSSSVYTIFAFERTDSFTGKIHSKEDLAKIGTFSKNGRNYDVYTASFAGYVGLVDQKNRSIEYLYSKTISAPTPTPPASARNTLQIQNLDPFVLQPWGWWSPECKPAIYLYPEQKSTVQVIVEPKGFLTYTDPLYPKDGWKVEASPDGTIVSNNNKYPYLYYESKIKDSEIEKPTKGYVVSYGELPSLFENILPQLGLSQKETKDFGEFWDTKLPSSPYYFVGVMTESAINRIEPLTVLPKPQTIIRVRLYFEALDSKKTVDVPELIAPLRNGFVVSEWGGVVKLHPGTEFTCSQ